MPPRIKPPTMEETRALQAHGYVVGRYIENGTEAWCITLWPSKAKVPGSYSTLGAAHAAAMKLPQHIDHEARVIELTKELARLQLDRARALPVDEALQALLRVANDLREGTRPMHPNYISKSNAATLIEVNTRRLRELLGRETW